MIIRRICVISQYYPTENDMIFSFVDQLITKFADSGIECSVITPMTYFHNAHSGVTREKTTANGNVVRIYCPRYIQFPNREIGFFSTYKLTIRSYISAITHIINSQEIEFDVIYAHFFNPSGIAAAIIGKIYSKYVFVASGESCLDDSSYALMLYKDTIQNYISGCIAVSSVLKDEIREKKLVSDRCEINVFPNGIDTGLFEKFTKGEARKKLGIADEYFIVIFIGHFIERKGIGVLVDALNQLDDVYAIFIGEGPISPDYARTLHKGPVKHEDINIYLSASDVFVLPTKAEGCCNAILEAMASGIPVVSSDLPFNNDILDESCSIRVDVTSSKQIASAINCLKSNPKTTIALGRGAREKARQFDITERANRIVAFIENNTEKQENLSEYIR